MTFAITYSCLGACRACSDLSIAVILSDMYTTVVDMMATLIHSAVVGDAQAEKPEENKRHYQTLAKKLRKVGIRLSPPGCPAFRDVWWWRG